MTDEQNNSTEQVVDIDSLRQDTHNFNRGTEQGQQLMEKSFSQLGAGRSILVDKNGNIIAGNKSQKAAKAAGISRHQTHLHDVAIEVESAAPIRWEARRYSATAAYFNRRI